MKGKMMDEMRKIPESPGMPHHHTSHLRHAHRT
jgi:hypothetical protein